ncbi:MAG: hypothetical protein ACTIIH_03455 [Brevibacterium sp.]|uniref:Uncharacterized protein n=1 Tax=Brevibacterium aurantiacum TaxID=273384 RepID=A0A2H1ITB8_BREAU|nr:hypothetical protein [Brevibacterium aurantiacum]AZL10755.1 hypothetical protein CXR26_17180 [Brevibacterium aurantiacum]GEB21636.1 hypothetical protein BAU01nite_03690 [Brevibacterium aurantiacum]SMX78435.1 hypothetical protein BAUR9175_01673 [Brevibacterium aurantiacum]
MNHRTFPSPVQFLLIGLCGFAVVLAPLVRSILPERFLLDDLHLQNAIDDPGFAPEDGSFHVLAQFYRAIGLESSPALASTVSMLVLVICLLLAVDFGQWDRAGLIGAGLLVLTVLLGLAYLAQFTKEFVSLLVALVVLLALRVPNGIVRAVLIVGACLTYGALVRPYWTLVAALIPVVYFVLRRIRHPLMLILAVVLAYIGLAIAFQIFRSEPLGATRSWVNSGRTESPVASMITNPDFGSSAVAGVVSILVVAFFLLVPVPLLAMGSAYYLVAAVAICLLWTVVVIAIVSGRAMRDSKTAWIASALVSLFLILVIFEPDYGSYLKHLTPFLPLFLALIPLRKTPPEGEQREVSTRSTAATGRSETESPVRSGRAFGRSHELVKGPNR